MAHAYEAACTPDFFLFDGGFNLVYRGQFDAAAPATVFPSPAKTCAPPSTRSWQASRSLEDQRPSIGCNIKWKA